MNKLPALLFISAIPAIVFCFCNSQKPASPSQSEKTLVKDSLPYDLQNPSLTINLADEALREISGLSPTDTPGVYLAIADERGEIFFLNSKKEGAVSRRILFRDKGDFEGVEMVNRSIWAVRSKGDIFEITDWEKNTPQVAEFKTPLKKHNDVEGLAYDPRRKALLLACKELPDSLYPRNIHVFNMKTKTLENAPAYSINPEEVNRMVPYGESEKHDYFSPSALAVHPLNGDVYVISTALKRLVVLDHETGKIKIARRLDKKIFPQPEGISFDAGGDLWISSEGKTGNGLLLEFVFKGKN